MLFRSFNVPIEGHAPLIMNLLLQAYLAAAGPRASDHESSLAEEMIQKVKAGMMIYAPASTFSDTSAAIVAALSAVTDHRLFGFCTDDILPHDLYANGHLSRGMRALIEKGVNPLLVYQMASWNVAQHYGLHGLGAIAPSYLADILLLDNLEQVGVKHVIVDGQIVVQDRKWVVEINEPIAPLVTNTVRIPSGLTEDSFRLHVLSNNDHAQVHGIDMTQIYTKLATLSVSVSNGVIELGNKLSMAAIVPRHGQGTAPSLAVISGFPLEKGAIASTVSHDSHNLAVVGKTPEDMLVAVRHLEQIGGGLVAVIDGKVIADVPLPIAGLMSPLPVPEIAAQLHAFEDTMPQLGLLPNMWFFVIALALPVLPEVRLTDLGLVNVASQEFIPLLA